MYTSTLVSDRLILRTWKETDLKPFIAMNQDEEVMRYFPKLLSANDTIALVQKISDQFDKYGFGLFALEDKLSNEFIGFTGFSIPSFEADFMPCIEIGWRLKKEFWGHGLATEAAVACLKLGFQTLHFDKIMSFTSKANHKSEHLMQRIGMHYAKDFDHPRITPGHFLCLHILYELTRANYFTR